MARLLHRSKSTKELGTKYELPDDGLPRSSAQFPPHTPNKLTRRRAGTVLEPKKLSPSKSTTDLRATVRQGLPSASRPPPAQNSSTNSLGTPNRQVFPGTYESYMESFLPRHTSKFSLSNTSKTTRIGAPLRSPMKEKHMYIGVAGDASESTRQSASTSITPYYIAQEPFDVKGNSDWSGKQGDARNGDQQEARGGWRKLFGRTLFGSKKTTAPAPHVAVLETSLQSRHIPIVTAANTRTTPTVNKIRREESHKRTIAVQKAKSRSPPHLSVEIPTVEMERYSIMFRGLLRDESPTKTQPLQKATLYDRRRSKEVLSGGTNRERPKLQLEPLKRHATIGGRRTPTPNIPDSTTPFPVPTKSNETPKIKVRLGRSNTTTALTRDPRPGPGFVLAGSTPDTDMIPSLGLQERRKLASIHSNLSTPETNRGSSGFKGSGRSGALSMNGSFDEGDDCWFQEQVSGPALPSTADGTKYSAAFERSPIMKGSPKSSIEQPALAQSTIRPSSSKRTPKESLQKQSPPRTEEELMIATQQSIQRQISISQRQLLLPVVCERTKLARVQTRPESTNTTSTAEPDEPRTVN